MQETPAIIYKIVPETLWNAAKAKGVFEGAAIDLTDGFIHFSTAKQVAETAARHFSGQVELLLIAVDGGALGDKLVYEPSRGGDLFPHLYASLPLTAVLWETPWHFVFQRCSIFWCFSISNGLMEKMSPFSSATPIFSGCCSSV